MRHATKRSSVPCDVTNDPMAQAFAKFTELLEVRTSDSDQPILDMASLAASVGNGIRAGQLDALSVHMVDPARLLALLD
ncbi:MAG: hypothetical protein WCI05_00165 [Myxococcales bacterium]